MFRTSFITAISLTSGDKYRVDMYAKLFCIALIFMLLIYTRQTSFARNPVYVESYAEDCINTFTVRVMVAASNTGAAWGTFDGSRIMIVRKGSDQQHCWLEMGQWTSDGRLEEHKRLQCLFSNPLEGG